MTEYREKAKKALARFDRIAALAYANGEPEKDAREVAMEVVLMDARNEGRREEKQ